ncbi:MAG TPA: hypothetical protein VLQ29_15470 [Candidatus Dormibacteraeota bacterium]|nr:hypothetical protein [Candidatus Dormibacteraeota bacterium]
MKCHAGCTLDAVLAALGMTQRDLFPQRFDWRACVDAFTQQHLERLAKWRGYSIEFCSWLKENGLVGMYHGCIAFPVHDRAGNAVACHFRLKDGSWCYPKGTKVRPLVIGELIAGDPVHVFESQWDAFAFMDKSCERSGIIITHGAGNGSLVAELILERSTVYLWTQNDAAGEKWERDVCANTKATVKRAKIPAPHKDLNDWARAGCSDKNLREAIVSAEVVQEALSPGDEQATGDSTDLTSLSSLHAVDYPVPLDEAAYHGLAGEVVCRIEPHTEADPVALLFQLLAGFGNMIGRTAYMLADGARHYFNIYCVLVGETSKGRKGTAWQHIRNILQHVVEAWCKNVAHGLSSGEGLIWAVRDPISEKKPVKKNGCHTGEYETVVTDHGVDDKRLLVIESEFANVLKVMTREGNTLSPVIRNAWETGKLRTLTKNSPARATEAHISIDGHITRQELRRLLSETESANGFGNRFPWVAVRRSKCLSEGGQAVGIADLVERLQKAVEFAKSCGELKRDDAARELGESLPDSFGRKVRIAWRYHCEGRGASLATQRDLCATGLLGKDRSRSSTRRPGALGLLRMLRRVDI